MRDVLTSPGDTVVQQDTPHGSGAHGCQTS
jgi:hypothetical protein